MTKRKFFRWVWQFNALAIAGVAVLGLILGGYGVIETARHLLRDRAAHTIARVPGADTTDDTATPKEILALGYFSKIEGHTVFWAPIEARQDYRISVYSKAAHSIRNYVFYDPSTGRTRRLLDTDKTVVMASRQLLATKPGGQRSTAAMFFQVVGEDTDKDGAYTRRDRHDLIVAKADGSGPTTIARGVDALHGADLVDDDKTILIVYSRKELTVAEHYSVADFKLIKRDPINRRQAPSN